MPTAEAISLNDTTAGTWPPEAFKLNPGQWCRCSQEHADYFLGVLPPIYFPGGFACSEPWTHLDNGTPTYLCVITRGRKPYAKHATISEAKLAAYGLAHQSPDTPAREDWRARE